MIRMRRPLTTRSLVLWISVTSVIAMGCSSALEAEQPLDGGPSQLDGLLGQCNPGEERCSDGYREVCGGNGLWIQTNEAGGCGGIQDSCAANATRRSYIGCEYWPVDLDNAIEVFPVPPR